jgi:hypothetical protein
MEYGGFSTDAAVNKILPVQSVVKAEIHSKGRTGVLAESFREN